MSDRPTPETDVVWVTECPTMTWKAFKMRDKARDLERQRDEAREQLDRICREGFGYQDTISLEPCADYALRKLKKERELARELRDALQELRSFYIEMTGLPPCAANAALAKAKEVLP